MTRELLEPGLLSLAEPGLLECISKVISNNCVDAWSIDQGEPDRTEWRRCRSAWQELYMFCKTCIPQLPGGQKKSRRNMNILVSRLERWKAGERRTLWDELPSLIRRPASHTQASPELQKAQRQEKALALTMQGMPGRAFGGSAIGARHSRD